MGFSGGSWGAFHLADHEDQEWSSLGGGDAPAGPSARREFLERAYGLLEVPGTYPGTYS